jgi:hypothetical protein
MFGQDEPYERLVTTSLAHALQAVEQAAENSASSGSVESFEAAVQKGVSANLCEAVAGLSSDGDMNRSVEFAFSWSRLRPVAASQVSRVVVARDRVPFVREAARLLRERAPVEGFDLEGPVVKLERADGAPMGYVTVYALVENEAKRVRVELQEAEYTQAVNAHRDGNDIRCSGRLVREGRGYHLKNPADFAVRVEGNDAMGGPS